MLHRMTALLSAVVIAFLATPVINAALSTSAQAAESCLTRPHGSWLRNSHGYYQTNRITHQKCWVFSARKAVARNIASPTARSVSPKTRAAILPPAVADANARFDDTFAALRAHAAAIAAETADENLAASRFISRWIDLSDQAHWIDLSDPTRSNDPQSNPPGDSTVHQPVFPDDATKLTRASGRSYAAEWLPNLTLIVLLVSLVGAFVLFALMGRTFIFARRARSVWPQITGREEIFRVPSELDTSDASSANNAMPAEVRSGQRLANPFAGLG
jgi:hypothetical protein